MKSRVIILFCALVAVCECQIGGDEGVKQELPNGQSKVEVTSDPFHQVTLPIVRNVYSKLNKYVNGIPVTITGPFIQNQNQYGDIKSQFNPLDAPRVKCGKQTCPRSWFVCQSGPCQYPSEFDEIVVRCRSSLQNAEEKFQSIAELLFTVSSKMVRDGVFIKIADAKSVYESTRPILEEVTENIESLEPFFSHEVIGQVAQDVLIDMEALQRVLNIFIQCLIEVDLGEQIKIPVSVYDRCFRPKDWIPQCSGRWPCTRIFLFPTRYAYSQQRPGCSCQRPSYQYGSRIRIFSLVNWYSWSQLRFLGTVFTRLRGTFFPSSFNETELSMR